MDEKEKVRTLLTESRETLLQKSISFEKRGQGIYILFFQGTIVYVGQTRHFNMRLGAHDFAGKAFDRYVFFALPNATGDELNNTEADLIIKFEPEDNRYTRR
jgi:hypothetical protein